MEKQIIEKLRASLSEDVDSECKVVYVLCESRKLLESYPPDPIPFALKLYFHWALHVDLTNPTTTLPFLHRVDDFVSRVLNGKTDELEDYRMFREFVLLDTFREQFRQFLSTYNLPTRVCDEDLRWHQFLKSYVGVIEDGSLSCGAKTQRLKLISEVIFVKGKRARLDDYLPFDLSWNIYLLDGRTISVDLNAASLPSGDQMISHVIRLH
jgi:hypothetical protein